MPHSAHVIKRLAAASAVLLSLASNALAANGRLTGSIGAGFDSYRERYSIIDSDTLDSFSEFRSRLSLGYAGGSFLDDLARVEGLALIGEDSDEYTGSLDLIKRLGSQRARAGLSADVTRRNYRDDSSYEFANDYTLYYLRAYTRWNVGPSVTMRIGDRLERIDYENRTEFDYDYTRNTVSLDAGFDWNITSFAGCGLGFTTMDIPDSTGIAYHAWIPGLELRVAPQPYRHVFLYATGERRIYADGSPRSSFFSLLSSASGELPLGEEFSVEARSDLELYTYDNSNDVYFDYTESRNAVLLNYNQSWEMHAGAGPAVAFFRSGDSPDDEYNELGARVVVEYSRGARVWTTASYERGHRAYSTYDSSTSDALTIYSDYDYHRISAILTARLGDGLSASLLLDYQPEDHEREGDDSTVTLFSASLTWSL